jgi:hypothetical protein
MARPFGKRRVLRFRPEDISKMNNRKRARRDMERLALEKEVHHAHLKQKAAAISKVRHPAQRGFSTRPISPKTLLRFAKKGEMPLSTNSRPRTFKRTNLVRSAVMEYYDLLRELRPIGGELPTNHPELIAWVRKWKKILGPTAKAEIIGLVSNPRHISFRELAPYMSSHSRIRWKKTEEK